MNSSAATKNATIKGGSRRKRGQKQRKMRGGSSGSAWKYELDTVGSGQQQFNDVFVRGGQFGAAIQNLSGSQPSVVAGAIPSAANLKLIQSAGGKKRRGSSMKGGKCGLIGGGTRRKKGGYWGKVISQALVPFGLLFAQNRYGTRKHRK